VDGRATERTFWELSKRLTTTHILKKAIQCGGLDRESNKFKSEDCLAVYNRLAANYARKVLALRTTPFKMRLSVYIHRHPVTGALSAPSRARLRFCSLIPEELVHQVQSEKYTVSKI